MIFARVITADLKVCSTPFGLTVWTLRRRFDYFLLTSGRTNWKVGDSLQSGKAVQWTIFDKRSCQLLAAGYSALTE
jgi:hypothetical protein